MIASNENYVVFKPASFNISNCKDMDKVEAFVTEYASDIAAVVIHRGRPTAPVGIITTASVDEQTENETERVYELRVLGTVRYHDSLRDSFAFIRLMSVRQGGIIMAANVFMHVLEDVSRRRQLEVDILSAQREIVGLKASLKHAQFQLNKLHVEQLLLEQTALEALTVTLPPSAHVLGK